MVGGKTDVCDRPRPDRDHLLTGRRIDIRDCEHTSERALQPFDHGCRVLGMVKQVVYTFSVVETLA